MHPLGHSLTVQEAVHGTAIAGGAALFMDGTAAWLGLGGVAAAHRGRGAHRALIMRRIADAVGHGAIRHVTETGDPVADEPDPSLVNLTRCGFRTARHATPRGSRTAVAVTAPV